ncbi:MAG: hypothetical protein OXB91_04885 [Bryobacterales bacterium]|nr:hypothetical protein [Bryobacterales bacterium]
MAGQLFGEAVGSTSFQFALGGVRAADGAYRFDLHRDWEQNQNETRGVARHGRFAECAKGFRERRAPSLGMSGVSPAAAVVPQRRHRRYVA